MSRDGRARLFVAVDLPAELREQLAGWARAALGVGGPRLIEPAALHVTLCFLGSRSQAAIDTIGRLVLGCAMPVPDLSLGAPLWLPPRRPRAVAVEVHDASGALVALQDAVSHALATGADHEPERRRFRPHVTVARTGARHRPPPDRTLAATPGPSFSAEALTLYRSHLERAGARYEPLARVQLA